MAEHGNRPALLVIDMQNDFVMPGSRLYNAGGRALIPAINRLAEAARVAGVPVVWVMQGHRPGQVDFGREGDVSPPHCVEGTAGAALAEGLAPQPGDLTVVKRRYSGFFGTDLDQLLRCLDCDRVVLAGINTDGCVLATALDAHARDYGLTVVADATSAGHPPLQAAALEVMSRMQPGVVQTAQAVIERWAAEPVAAEAA